MPALSLSEIETLPFVEQLAVKSVDLDSVKVPYILEGKVLLSPGVWNGNMYTANAIEKAFKDTEWSEKNRALFLDHIDNRTGDWIGEVTNIRLDGQDVVGDLVVVDKTTAIKLAYGAKFGISPKVSGREKDAVIQSFTFDNFSIVIDPACKTTYLNSQIKKEGAMKVREIDGSAPITAELSTEQAPAAPAVNPPVATELSEADKLKAELADVKKALAAAEEEAKKKKYPYPEEEMAKHKKMPPEEEEGMHMSDADFDKRLSEISADEQTLSEWTKFFAAYAKAHKGEGPVSALMKKAAAEFKKTSASAQENSELVTRIAALEEKLKVAMEPQVMKMSAKGTDAQAAKAVTPEEADGAFFQFMLSAQNDKYNVTNPKGRWNV